MADRADVIVYYSLQSDYCYFLLDRLLELRRSGISVEVRPILGGVIRAPELYKNRNSLEQEYFKTDTQRTADQQPRNERLYRLFVGAWQAGQALEFLTSVGRMLWDSSTQGWDQGQHLQSALNSVGLNERELLDTTPWDEAKDVLEFHAEAIIAHGHWGVPLMVFQGEPFYGQDRFDQLIWCMKERQAVQ